MIEGDRGSFNLITSRGLIEEIKVAAPRWISYTATEICRSSQDPPTNKSCLSDKCGGHLDSPRLVAVKKAFALFHVR